MPVPGSYVPLVLFWPSFDGSDTVLMCSKKLRVRVLKSFGEVSVAVPPWSQRSMHEESSMGPARTSALWASKYSSLRTGLSLATTKKDGLRCAALTKSRLEGLLLTIREINVVVYDIGFVAGVGALHAVPESIGVLLEQGHLNGCGIGALLEHGELQVDVPQ